MQVVLAHDPPDSVITDIAQSFGNQAAIPSARIPVAAFGLTEQRIALRPSHC